MPYTDLQHLAAAEFKRLCGVSHETFKEMAEVLRPDLERQGQRGGQNKLSVEDQLLITLFVLARGSDSVSRRYKLEITRNHGRADSQKSRRCVGEMR